MHINTKDTKQKQRTVRKKRRDNAGLLPFNASTLCHSDDRLVL